MTKSAPPPPLKRNNQKIILRLDSNPEGKGGFVAAVEVDDNGIVTVTAPILHWMRGWTAGRVYDYCNRKGWECRALLLWEP